ncbi:MAG: hypothetical protein KDC35_11165 [Acidobacteria bacterium]|nr:hypothetical protein [Acidobacteriota bacterium]
MNCPQCDTFNPSTAQVCDCGYRFTDYEKQPKRKSPPQGFRPINRWLGAIFAVSSLTFLVLFFFKPSLPARGEMLQSMFMEPLQTEDAIPESFEVTQKGLTYLIHPKFNYQLNGLVVSTHAADALSDVLHEQWQDYLNIMDMCVIWGPNLENDAYQRIEFTSGNFTCYCRWFDELTGRQFKWDAISNNHLLTDDRRIAKRIRSVRPGDQVTMSGFLASYENPAYGFKRGTSTTRTDTGNGACETVYVTDFEIVKKGAPIRRFVKSTALLTMAISAIAFVALPFLFRH